MMAGNPDWWSMHLQSSICPQNVSHVTSLSRLDFSYNKADHMKSQLPDHTYKVKKEKLGDRIKTLHQLVSPFGKKPLGISDFLHSQIEALSYPYFGSGSENMRNQESDAKDNPKDLRSRGLCLVPVSFTQHVGKSKWS